MSDSPPLSATRRLVFDAFHVDLAGQRLWRQDREMPLRPKAWDVLRYLVERPGLLVTKETLHREIWPDAVVSDDTLTKSISELRQALGDSSRTPRIIQTVYGRGFRFVAEVHGLESDAWGPRGQAPPPGLTDDVAPEEAGPTFVGRRAELGRLHRCLGLADRGTRQVVFITGEAGIGKTTLSEEFLRSLALHRPDVWVLRGQCIQQHGQREPYMPVLEALERGLGSPRGSALIPLFRRIAPCWYVQIPWLLSETEPAGFRGSMLTAPPERMLREIGAFLEAVAATSTIVLVLEDLHWSDHTTTAFLGFLAERRDPARLLVVGTYRPAEASALEHPIREVKRTLRSHRRCVDLALDYLSVADVGEYVQRRFGLHVPGLVSLVHKRTDGNPLFVVGIIEELIRRRQLVKTDDGWAMGLPVDRLELAVPEDLLDMVTAQFHGLSPDERAVLEAASVVGVTFTSPAVAHALGQAAEDVDAMTQRMVRAHLFVNAADRGEDHGPAARYEFSHALHHQAIYEQLAPLRRRRLHLKLAEALESTGGERVAELAPELSVHFQRGGDPMRAAKYLSLCVTRAQQYQAPHEAIACAELALELLRHVPDSAERRHRELELRLLLGVSLSLTGGFSAPAVRDNYERARALCDDTGDARPVFEIMHAVWHAQMARSKFRAARETMDEIAAIARQQPVPEFRSRADLAEGRLAFWSGRFGEAASIFTQFLEGVARQPIEMKAQTYGLDPVIVARGHGSLALWFLGHPDQARAWAAQAIAYADDRREPFGLASALTHATVVELLCGRAEEAARHATRAATVAADHAVTTFRPMSRFFNGAVLAAQGNVEGGLAEMLPALVEHREVLGSLIADIMLGFLAAAYGQAARWDEGLRSVEDGLALSEIAGEHVYAAELWRVKGELLVGKSRSARGAARTRMLGAARQCLHRALEIGRTQDARSLELRTAMSLVRSAERDDEARDARKRLRALYDAFTEGFDTKDLEDAKALLNGSRVNRTP